MNRDDIIRMAREAGFEKVVAIDSNGTRTVTIAPVLELEHFATLVAAPLQERIQLLYEQLGEAEKQLDAQYKLGMEAEREACAWAIDLVALKYQKKHYASDENVADECAAAIRARGETK